MEMLQEVFEHLASPRIVGQDGRCQEELFPFRMIAPGEGAVEAAGGVTKCAALGL